jgi:hypothetical protein
MLLTVYKLKAFTSKLMILFFLDIELDESLFRSLNGSSSVESLENIQLPDTVTKLTTPYRSTVYLVGTAHFSESSQEDVRKVILPHVLCLFVWFHFPFSSRSYDLKLRRSIDSSKS